MTNLVVITVGTSDVQLRLENVKRETVFSVETENEKKFLYHKEKEIKIEIVKNRNYEDYYLFKNPRSAGESVLKHLSLFKEVICFPIAERFFNYLKKNQFSPDAFMWVYTNQQDENFKHSDTLYYKEILQNFASSIFQQAKHISYEIKEKVRDIDFQYQDFLNKAKQIIEQKDHIQNIWILPQGGIDQINHSLTLQFLRYFRHKVKLFQAAEKDDVTELQFPKLFLTDLMRETLIKHIEDYDFDKALPLEDFFGENLTCVFKHCRYLHNRLTLNHHLNLPEENQEQTNEIDKQWEKLQDLVYYIKILINQKKYNEALIRLYTYLENIFKLIIEKKLQVSTSTFYDYKYEITVEQKLPRQEVINERWVNFLKEKFGEEMVEYLRNERVKLNNPNNFAYFRILRKLTSDKKFEDFQKYDTKDIKKLFQILDKFRNLRNDIVHRLGAVDEETFEGILKEREMQTDDFFRLLDKLTETRDLGIYKENQLKILNMIRQ
ncbi:MAG: hypothetical protein N2747_10180 [Chitinophagaceae bacterium]|nr:hypothetical protein [Chitinophagaceae bacterium]